MVSSDRSLGPASAHIPSVVFSPPALPAVHVRRPGLEALLGPEAACRLSLVVGPPGSGKTTLVRSYLDHITGPWSWLMVDASLGHRDGFASAFVRAVQLAHPGRALDAVDLIGNDAMDAAVVLTTLVEDLVRLGDPGAPAIVVVDDAHHLGADGWTDLQWLIGHQPRALHLVVVSRADPPFSITRWRVAGDVVEIRAADLAFSARDAVTLFERGLPGRADGPSLAVDVRERTEGWPTGLRLAMLALQRGAAGDALLAHFTGTHGSIAEVLVAEVLEHQPNDVRDFLRTTSILRVLEPDLCAALTDRPDCHDVLRRLAHDQVFIAPIEGHLDWYRYHPMLAELLRHELRAGRDGTEAALQRRAAAWFEQEGRYAEAIEHAVAAADDALAFDLIVAHQRSLTVDGRRSDVARWLLAIPERFTAAESDRAVEMCAALLFVGRAEWVPWRRRLPDIVGDRDDLWLRMYLFDAIGCLTQGRVAGYQEAMAGAAGRRPANHVDPLDEVVDAWRVRLFSLQGQHASAVELATSVVQRDRQLITDAPAHSLLAGALHLAGDGGAVTIARRAVQQWQELGEPDLLGMVDALVVLTEEALTSGRPDEGELFSGWAVAATTDPPPHLLTVRAALAMAGVERATGRDDHAARRLRSVYQEARIAGVDPLVLALMSVAAAPAGRPTPTAGRTEVGLTEREMGILRLLSSHLTFPEIGREAYISRHTVKTHVTRIYRKLGVSSRSAAVDEARRRGVLSA